MIVAKSHIKTMKRALLAATCLATPFAAGLGTVQEARAQSVSCSAYFCGTDSATWWTGASNGAAGWNSNDDSDNGGAGATGGVASVQNNGQLNWALYAEAPGGAGGSGGNAGWDSGSDGGAGGQGGTANATNVSVISVGGNINRSGLTAQAQGGAGGVGGDSSTWAGAGNGGNGGNGGTANATNAAGAYITINTAGTGIFATSDGGVGANNLDTAAPGNGGNGGVTNVTNSGTIITNPANADGIWASSLGGNGGSGNPSSGAGNVGGTGGNGGTVNLTNNGAITTSGASSSGIDVSVGGGIGGVGGSTGLGDASAGGVGGNGGTVTLINNGTIATSGALAYGILAFSNGGTGGAGGTAYNDAPGGMGGSGGTVNITANGTITALGSGSGGSPAIGAFANGGTGGGAADDVSGGNGGRGGLVTVNANLSVSAGGYTTTGASSPAVYLTANGGVGGVGGPGGWGGNANVATANITGVLATSGSESPGVYALSNGGAAGANIGQNDATGGGAGWATVVTLGDSSGATTTITTSGTGARGVDAEAVGGAGGTAGPNGGAFSYTGYSGGSGGNGGTVYVGTWSNTTITTQGSASAGIYALSQGGAGGTGGVMVSSGDGGVGGAGGGGNYVTVNLGGQSVISTVGDNSYGVFAESSGGTGGTGGEATGGVYETGGAGGAAGSLMTWNSANTNYQVAVTNYGTAITTQGDYAFGIFAVSNGGTGGSGGASEWTLDHNGGDAGAGTAGGNILVQLNAGTITTSGYESFGVVASSIGGGGGNGGSADGWCLAVCVSVGGTGGLGGNGGLVTVANNATISTSGTGASGIFALSVGGGGGNGGEAASSAVSVGPSVSVSIGGNGGPGGTGGTVDVTNNGTIITTAMDASGILAQSIGGGGGGGGQASASAYSAGYGDVPAISLSVAVGGTGGTAGDGGTVTVTNNGTISTYDSQSAAIAAYSIGGGGGTGGNATAASYTYGKTPAVSISTAVGGNGGGGGTGGSVDVTNTGSLFTNGYSADGILAMSIGGGGGNGGLGTATLSTSLPSSLGVLSYIPVSTGTSGGISVGVGGAGAGGGNGGAVTVTNSGTITTLGTDARGIFAQSVGGGGGSGGAGQGTGSDTYTVNVSVGGSGSGGGTGGGVTVTNQSAGLIKTNADGAHGIFAQSVGGGGGNGGSGTADSGDSFMDSTLGHETVNGIVYLAKSWIINNLPNFANKIGVTEAKWPKVSVSANVGVGGTGGAGGDGGIVDVTNSGNIATVGDVAFGIFAQSIGGGGGTGGAATVAGGEIVNTSVGVGGSGGIGGVGNTVTVNNTGSIATSGNSAFGILAQSAGGGGGTGGLATDPQTLSIDFSVKVGGSNLTGSGLEGGTVTLTNGGSVSTQGEEAHALVAQSVGGGGGIFFLNEGTPVSITGVNADVDAALAEVMAAINQTAQASSIDLTALLGQLQSQIEAASGSVTLTLGASGGLWKNNGGTATVTHAGAITTTGNGAMGILAQSIGGGGGFATDGAGSSASITLGNGSSMGGGIGDGGSVTVSLASGATIVTHGAGSAGIFAQSIGGGGGYGGMWDALGFSYSALLSGSTGIGNGGLVTINAPAGSGTTAIVTNGMSAHGIFAQSLSGGGGAVSDISGLLIPGTSGNAGRAEDPVAVMYGTQSYTQALGVSINYAGTISATGENSVGIFAQSGTQGTSGAIITPSGTIDITFAGTLLGGSYAGAAIQIDGGLANSINLLAGSTVSALSGTSVIATGSGTTTLNNYGTLWGGIDFSGAGSASAFNNYGNFYSGGTTISTTVNLGSAAFTNYGTMNSGGPGITAATQITGNFVQASAGTLVVDVNTAGTQTTDTYTVSGSASLGGQLQFNATGSLLPGTYSFLSANNGINANATIAASPLNVITWSVISDRSQASTSSVDVTGALQLSVTPLANFQPTGVSLTQSEQNLAQHLQSSWNNADSRQATTFAALANIQTLAGYENQLDSLSAEENNAPSASQTTGARTSMHAALSCPAFSGASTLLQETDCAWARVIAGRTEQYSTAQVNGYTIDSLTNRIGMQREIQDDWFLGATLGFTSSNFNPANGYSGSDGQSGDVAVSVKRQIGPWLLSLTGHLGFGGYDNERYVTLGSNTWRAESSSSVITAGGRVLRHLVREALCGLRRHLHLYAQLYGNRPQRP